jgi:hypothetical protein
VSHELLLTWLSERAEGTLKQFRVSHDWLLNRNATGRVSPEVTAHALSMSGHLEVNWRGGRWCISPPVLTILPDAGAYALLVGARTRKFMEKLEAETHEEVTMGIDWHRHAQWDAPDAVFLATEDETEIERLAERLGISYEFSVSDRISRMLPTLEDALRLTKSTPGATGYGVERFDSHTLSWRPEMTMLSAGLYRIDFPGHYEYRFGDGSTFFAPDRQTGIYLELARTGRSVLSFKRQERNGTLVVPTATPLPILHARCAVLCSGLSPTPSQMDGVRRFVNVPEETAIRIANSLNQALAV